MRSEWRGGLASGGPGGGGAVDWKVVAREDVAAVEGGVVQRPPSRRCARFVPAAHDPIPPLTTPPRYAAAWCTHSVQGSRGGAASADFEDQAVIVNGNSRWCNYYVEGVRWLLRHLGLDGIYLDGIRFPRATSQRLRHVFDAETAARRAGAGAGGGDGGGGGAADAAGGAAASASAPLLDLHAGPNLRSFLEHMPYLDSLWVGESRLWTTACRLSAPGSPRGQWLPRAWAAPTHSCIYICI